MVILLVKETGVPEQKPHIDWLIDWLFQGQLSQYFSYIVRELKIIYVIFSKFKISKVT